MFTQSITLDRALELSDSGYIIIVDCSPDIDTSWHERAKEWKDNYLQLRTKARHVSPEKLMSWYRALYTIEIPLGCTNKDTQTYEWRNLYGIENPEARKNLVNQDKGTTEYVYALTNDGYPDLVKIGMTTNTPEKRLSQINGTGTVDVWKLRFALPLQANTSYKVEQQVHKYFQDRRYHAVHENDREMFKVTLFEAIDKIREIGKLFQAGNPLLY